MSMAISSVNSLQSAYVNRNAYNDRQNVSAIATGSRFSTTAASDIASYGIYERMGSILNGLNQGIQNTGTMSNLATTAEGGLSSISESLQRVRELSLQSQNATLNEDDRQRLQGEITGLLQGVGNVAQSTEFNGMNLLDGTFVNRNVAMDPYGTGATISIGDMSLGGLGLSGFTAGGVPDIAQIDRAIDMVGSTRASVGAMVNRFGYSMNNNAIAGLNVAAARSRLADTNIARAAIDQNRSRVLNQYQALMQITNLTNARNQVNTLA